MKLRFTVTAAVLTVLSNFALASCSSEEDQNAASSAEVEPQEAEASEEYNYERVLKATIITPPDRKEYLRKLELRAEGAGVLFGKNELVRHGKKACSVSSGYVTGSRPDQEEQMIAYLFTEGYSPAVADYLAYPILNSSRDTLCSVKSEEISSP